jgi:hypothetical protein
LVSGIWGAGDFESARSEFSEALALNPNHTGARDAMKELRARSPER